MGISWLNIIIDSSSHPELFCKSALTNFAKFEGKHMRRSLFLAPSNFIKRSQTGVFIVDFEQIS